MGCSQNETPETSVGESSPEMVTQTTLLDVQALWGGRDLWISSDGRATYRLVKPQEKGGSGLRETRYSFTLTGEQSSALAALIKKHNFFSIKTKVRNGMPDEAHPGIVVKLGAQTHTVSKWANNTHKDFDPIYQFLLDLSESGKKGEQTYSGTYDWNWKPE